ncbi:MULTISPECIES: beta-ketoacyl synthase N-terminal-like domain-containing protein [Streptomyces]|uniref:beta-ketoacyl synthase N-terminal-like domain-containing protein n=1 Tax=Streptomyces TaxID=1883 RepID=UPI00163CF227|nr:MULTISPECIES: beta-ketoacyl synthase N-terminal-like domain-containing protein [Streptomyces]MBC2877573.1 3-oxoacyl-ACP synthase [Streptomyces sp. TYQ1024]UBI36187.1 3-oxoacyl-ACP synthase [Streptomyces mobaraensis]UKW28781.1 3-oxoacyl-ACP synthase [Streptomyces sp. TYQ1024]
MSAGELAVVGMGIVAPGVTGPDDASAPAREAAPGWFRADVALPGRGYRRLPDACKYLLAASRLAVRDAGDRFAETAPDDRGATVAMNHAGAALLEELDGVITREGAAELPPSAAPFIAMSSFAGRLSIEHGITGFSLTLNSPVTAGLEALAVAARAVAAGRARTVLVGAVEEALSPSQAAGGGWEAGAAVLQCEPATEGPGGGPYGTCRARGGFLRPDAGAGDAAATFARLTGDDPPARVEAVLDDSAVGTAAARWLDRMAAGGCEVAVVPADAQAGCLTPLRRVMGLLAREHPAPARCAVLAASALGSLAWAEVRVAPRGTPATGHRGTD